MAPQSAIFLGRRFTLCLTRSDRVPFLVSPGVHAALRRFFSPQTTRGLHRRLQYEGQSQSKRHAVRPQLAWRGHPWREFSLPPLEANEIRLTALLAG